MNGLLQTIGVLIWRSSWQASLLAILVALLIWGLGDRIAARWRYALWSIVLVRFLLLLAPASPWSLFHLAQWPTVAMTPPTASIGPLAPTDQPSPVVAVAPCSSPAISSSPASGSVLPPASSQPPVPAAESAHQALEHDAVGPNSNALQRLQPAGQRGFSIGDWLALTWLSGCVFFAGRLLIAFFSLRRQFARCQPVRDGTILGLLESVRRDLGLRRPVGLFVTADPISPCVVGAWRPRLIVPELALTELAPESLRQVFSHELAHIVRGDLWTNWLLLSARTLHWFNPFSWWMVWEMQATRELACDERTLAALDADERQTYADTILNLVGLLSPSPPAPGMVALFSSRRRLSRRIERILHLPVPARRAHLLAIVLIVVLALAGLTDAVPLVADESAIKPAQAAADDVANPQASSAPPPVDSQVATERASYTLRGQTIELHRAPGAKKQNIERTQVGQVELTLYRVRGLIGAAEKVAEGKSDNDGRFQFDGLAWPNSEGHFDRLAYGIVARAPGRPPTIHSLFEHMPMGPEGFQLQVGGKAATISGQVVNEQGQPIAGALVTQFGIHRQSVPGLQIATTDKDGRFSINDLSLSALYPASEGHHFYVWHPDYPTVGVRVGTLSPEAKLTVPTGCTLTGIVSDEVSGQPAAGAVVTAQNNTQVADDAFVVADNAGRYRLVVVDGNYNIFAEAVDRVCIAAITNQVAMAAQTVELPPLKFAKGGWIVGRVLNTKTGTVVVDVADAPHRGSSPLPKMPRTPSNRIAIGLFGPSYPGRTKVILPLQLARVDDEGRFRLRAAAGENFPYLVNTHGERMAWDTKKQAAVVVQDGQTVNYDMLIEPEATDEEKMNAAAEVVARMPKELPQRVDQIIAEFRKLNHTVDETETWCSLMRELVAIGPPAVPALCAELDKTSEQRMMRRLGFALRAIGDPRAVPALIRAIPKTLQPSMSDYGLVVGDEGLTKFMQQHDVDDRDRGQHFSFGRPVREVFGALEKLTKQKLGEEAIFMIHLADDPNSQKSQRRLYHVQADRWQAWWDAHWREFTSDKAYSRVDLPVEPQSTPQPVAALGPQPRLGEGVQQEVLSPSGESGTQFLDLDTGLEPKWPDTIRKDEQSANQGELALWAAQQGVDLMCVTYRTGDQSFYALRSFNMRLQEISLRDAKNIGTFLQKGTLPTGEPAGELLLHQDKQTGRYVADNAAFLYLTREGGLGLIELTDQVTEARDITGMLGAPNGVGFHKGVRFNYKPIIP
jgi:beta-lactamase regulating signal transducer with metallopeptidase domain